MTPDQSIGRIMTADEALIYYQRCIEAEKKLGPLSLEEKCIILSTVGKNLTAEDLKDMIAGKRVLVVKSKENPDATQKGE